MNFELTPEQSVELLGDSVPEGTLDEVEVEAVEEIASQLDPSAPEEIAPQLEELAEEISEAHPDLSPDQVAGMVLGRAQDFLRQLISFNEALRELGGKKGEGQAPVEGEAVAMVDEQGNPLVTEDGTALDAEGNPVPAEGEAGA